MRTPGFLRVFIPLLTFHCIALVPFVIAFGYPVRIIPAHALLAGAVLTVLLFVLAALARSRPAAMSLGVLVLTSYLTVFTAFYVSDFCANFSWGAHLSIGLIIGSPVHIQGLLESFPQAKWPLAGFFIVVVLAAGLVSRKLMRILVASAAGEKTPPSFVLRLGAPLAYLAVATFAFLSQYDVYTMGWFAGEPLAELFREDVSGFVSTPERVALSAREAIERNNYPRNKPFTKRNVIVIVVDDMRPANMGLYGYSRETTPFLQALKASGHLHVVSNATTPCPESICGIMSIFTSKDLSHMSHASFGIHGLLRDEGYKVNFLLAGDHHWYGLDKFYGQDIDFYRDGKSECPFGINDDRCLLQYLDELPASDSTPQVFGIHLMSAHGAGVQLPEWKRWTPASRFRVNGTRATNEEIVNGYDNGILQADQFVSQIFSKLEAKGYLEDAIVVIAADHGESLGEHDAYGHGSTLHQTLLRVPLLIYDAHEHPPFADPRHGSLMDVAPTVLDLLKLPIPETWMGISLLREHPPVRTTFHQTRTPTPWHAIVEVSETSRTAFLLRMVQGKPQDEELYDLKTDPEETRNRFAPGDPTSVRMREQLLRKITR